MKKRKKTLVKTSSSKKNRKSLEKINKKIQEGSKKSIAVATPKKEKAAIREEDLTGMIKIRYLLGKIFETVQYLEYNLSLLLQYSLILKACKASHCSDSKSMQRIMKDVKENLKEEKVDLQTFGNLISTLSEYKVLEKGDLDELSEILQTRNNLAHQFFKKNKFEEQEKNATFLEGQANYLTHFQNRVMNFNDRVCSLLQTMGNQISKISK